MTVDVYQKYDLPSDWKWVKLGDICAITDRDHRTPQYFESGVPLISPRDFIQGGIDFTHLKFVGRDELEAFRKKCKPELGDILYSRIGTIGEARLLNFDFDFVALHSIALIKPINKDLQSKYILYLLQTNDVRTQAKHNVKSVGTPDLGLKRMKDFDVPLAPPAKQKLIVAEIDKQFSRLDEAVAGLKHIKANLKRYKASVLKAAVEGKLTEEWRSRRGEAVPRPVLSAASNRATTPEDRATHRDAPTEYESGADLLKRILAERKKKWEAKYPSKKYKEPAAPDTSNLPQLPAGWVWATTDQLFSFVTSGSRGWASYYSESGPVFLRMGNLDHETIQIDLTDIQRVSPPEGTEGSRTRVMPGDILISITADVGMVGLVPHNFEEAYINQHVALGRPSSYAFCHEYLAWFLACKNGQDQLKKLQRGATKVGLGLDDIRSVNIPLPSLPEQQAIIAEVDRRLSLVREVEAQVDANLKRADRLRQGILKKAFSGKL